MFAILLWKRLKKRLFLKNTFGILAGVFTVGIVLYVSGLGGYILNLIDSYAGEGTFMNVVVLVAIAGLVFLAVKSGNKGNGKKD